MSELDLVPIRMARGRGGRLAGPRWRSDGWRPRYAGRAKRGLDLVLLLLLAPALVPILLLVACLASLDGGPALFAHDRVGRGGRRFRCWKIRTMGTDAEARLQTHLACDPVAAEEWARDRKLRRDPRVTRVGAILRRTSLDELPQLWNVLRGDMSLVGPRPVVEEELSRYGAALPDYLSLRPGVTGLWQVSGRNDVDYDARVALDRRYAAGLSLGLDLAILGRTLGAVVWPTGR